MNNLFVLLVIILHIYTIYHAIKNIGTRNGGFRVVWAFFPPLIGPIIYFATMPKVNLASGNRVFMGGKRRFS
jgi:hypothetical protein